MRTYGFHGRNDHPTSGDLRANHHYQYDVRNSAPSAGNIGFRLLDFQLLGPLLLSNQPLSSIEVAKKANSSAFSIGARLAAFAGLGLLKMSFIKGKQAWSLSERGSAELKRLLER